MRTTRLTAAFVSDRSLSFFQAGKSMVSKRLMSCVLASSALLALTACGGGQQQQAPQGPPTVGYVVAREAPVTLTTELPGRTTAFETSEVRPQVNGIVLDRLFVEGDVVHKGQALY